MNEIDIAERFKRDTAEHAMTILHDDGLYRHLRFTQPDSSFYWFEIVTWPGTLAVRGDCGAYLFSRTRDMFEFFRHNGNDRGINPGYWAEKTPSGRESVQEYSEDVFKAALEEQVAEHEKNYPSLVEKYRHDRAEYAALPQLERWPYGQTRNPVEPKTPSEVRELIAEHEEDTGTYYEAGARELLSELENAGVVADTWEWDLSDWSWTYLWCCHAIVWGIAQYDAALGEAGAPVVTAELAGVSR